MTPGDPRGRPFWLKRGKIHVVRARLHLQHVLQNDRKQRNLPGISQIVLLNYCNALTIMSLILQMVGKGGDLSFWQDPQCPPIVDSAVGSPEGKPVAMTGQ